MQSTITLLAKSKGIVPSVWEKVLAVLADMSAAGHPMWVTDGFRTVAQQKALYAQGRTKPGPKVTNCDGVKNPSNHQSGRAVDCCFEIDGKPSWEGPWKLYGDTAKKHGFKWGGDWAKPDRPHIEMI